MENNGTDGRYCGALRRLAVILLALSAIAEGAACRIWPVRSLLLWLLARAEERVRGFAVRVGAVPFISAGYAADLRVRKDAAERLASAFRALAAGFFALARRARQWLLMARRNHAAHLAGTCRKVVRASRPFAVSRALYADTS
jgi:hypothetical protein